MRMLLGLLLLSATMLGGCASPFGNSPQTHFYTLERHEGYGLAGQLQVGGERLGLGPLLLPDVLDRPQIVSRGDGHELLLAEFAHWGGSLDAQVLRVLQQELASALPGLRIDPHPWGRFQQPDLQLRIEVLRFDGQLLQTSVLEGSWMLLDRKSGAELTRQRFHLRESVDGAGYPALVASYARLLRALSRQLADGLQGRIQAPQ